MATTPCPTDTQLMPAALEEPAPADLQAHLDHCPECRRRVGRLRVEIQALRAAPSDRGGTTVPAGEAAPSPEPYPILIGGKYRVVGPLGRGGQGLVYRAVHLELQQDVAIKLACKPLGRDLVEDEGRLLADLKHPNLVQVHDLDFHEGRPFLVMEFVRGRTLEQLARGATVEAPAGRGAGGGGGAGGRLPARPGGRPPGHQAAEHPDRRGRPAAADRLRDGAAAGRLGSDADGPSGGTLAYMAPEQRGASRTRSARPATSSRWGACSTSC